MKAHALKNYFGSPRKVIHARLISASREADAEVFEVGIDVDLPQRPVYKIKRTERVLIRLRDDDSAPQVFALRPDFPLVPHLVINERAFPRQLCLYERGWAEERANWAPRPFIERIRHWFSGTADGTLHPFDQPLEPIMMDSPLRVVLPAIPYVEEDLCRVERLYVLRQSPTYWRACREKPLDQPKLLPMPVLVVRGPLSHHGIVQEWPLNFAALDDLLTKLGGSLVTAISQRLGEVRQELNAHAKAPLLIVVQLPKSRTAGGPRDNVECHAFLAGREVGDLFRAEKKYVEEGGIVVPRTVELFADIDRLKAVELTPLAVRWQLTPEAAAVMNGQARSAIKVLAIGAGAIGSPVITHLWRGGYGQWTIADDDVMEPHNPARHQLSSDAVGFNKAVALAALMHSIFPDNPPPTALPCNYLAPGNCAEKLAAALKDAEVIADFSASVPVARRLAVDGRAKARRISAFLNQRGEDSVVLAEDGSRKIDLFWLEAEYYRAVVSDCRLFGHFDDAGTVAHRYGNACREISSSVPQDGIAIHSGLIAAAIRRVSSADGASITIHRWSRNKGMVQAIEVPVSAPVVMNAGGWKVFIHPDTLSELYLRRAQQLPNETGGVLWGIVDRDQASMAIIGMLPAPPDSESWPTSFVRGSNGLAEAIGRLKKRSLQNVAYLGEWHSHPDHCPATPSLLDLQALALNTTHTRADGLPTVMLIVAQHEINLVVLPLDEDEPRILLVA